MKAAVFDALIRVVGDELAGVERMARLASDEATGSESKSEGKYDTRATEASYLARGQAERVVALRRLLTWLEAAPRTPTTRVGLASLVEVDEDGERRWFVVLPDGGGFSVDVGPTVQVITSRSPVGAALVGASPGDDVEIDGTERVLEVVSVA